MSAELVEKRRTDPAEVARQVTEIARVMSAGEWRPGHSHRDLAERWGVSITVVERRAAEASREVRRALGDPEELRSHVLSQLSVIVADARAAGDQKTAVIALRTISDIAGIVIQKHSHRVELEVEKMTPDQVWARLEEMVRENFDALEVVMAKVRDERRLALAEGEHDAAR